MIMTNIVFHNGIANIEIIGRVTSSNAPAFEQEIWEKVDFKSCREIVIDAAQLELISSAGLRIFLKMKKLCPKFVVKNVNSEVYEVFEMTGFTEMMTVVKEYRKLSVEGCEILGEGSNGIVYRYDPEIVVKVYRNTDTIDEVERERRLARKALVLGIPTAISFDVAKVGDKYATVFELLNATSFSKLIAANPDKIDDYIALFVDLLKKIHATKVDRDELTDMKQVAVGWAEFLKDYLPEAQSEKLISLIQAVPERNTMLHGDYHTNNVQMQDGEVLLIDMDTLSFGHPVFEFGSMFLGFVGFGELDHDVVLKFMKLPYETTSYIWHKVLELYFGTADDAMLRQIEDRAKLVGYARLLRRTIRRIGFDDPYGKRLIEHCKARLAELLLRIDSLDFCDKSFGG